MFACLIARIVCFFLCLRVFVCLVVCSCVCLCVCSCVYLWCLCTFPCFARFVSCVRSFACLFVNLFASGFDCVCVCLFVCVYVLLFACACVGSHVCLFAYLCCLFVRLIVWFVVSWFARVLFFCLFFCVCVFARVCLRLLAWLRVCVCAFVCFVWLIVCLLRLLSPFVLSLFVRFHVDLFCLLVMWCSVNPSARSFVCPFGRLIGPSRVRLCVRLFVSAFVFRLVGCAFALFGLSVWLVVYLRVVFVWLFICLRVSFCSVPPLLLCVWLFVCLSVWLCVCL